MQDPNIVHGNYAHNVTMIYHDGILRPYAHLPIQATVPGGSEEYHRTLIEGFDIRESPKSLRRGITAFRNAREWAMKNRDKFKAVANAKMQNLAPKAASDLPASPSCLVS